jgi:hypothetical protein
MSRQIVSLIQTLFDTNYGKEMYYLSDPHAKYIEEIFNLKIHPLNLDNENNKYKIYQAYILF